VETVGNFQGKLRYDRYIAAPAALFLIATGRNDRFQGLEFRLNVDPGFKYVFAKDEARAVWIEAGYDFQFDDRRADSLAVSAGTGPAGAMRPVPSTGCTPTDSMYALDGNIAPCAQETLSKTQTYHSARLFAGFRNAFNKDVTLSAGVEYLQSLGSVDAGPSGNVYDSRLNIDALFAAKVSGGLSVGFGIHAAYDQYPLPGKQQLETASTVTLIYSYSDIPSPPQPPSPCSKPVPPEVTPPPPPPSASSAAAPSSTPPPASSTPVAPAATGTTPASPAAPAPQ
jgi:hypothetical protein